MLTSSDLHFPLAHVTTFRPRLSSQPHLLLCRRPLQRRSSCDMAVPHVGPIEWPRGAPGIWLWRQQQWWEKQFLSEDLQSTERVV